LRCLFFSLVWPRGLACGGDDVEAYFNLSLMNYLFSQVRYIMVLRLSLCY
jgi:hypothetical protein